MATVTVDRQYLLRMCLSDVLRPGEGLCLKCRWSSSDDNATARHTRCTGHPTIFRPREPEPDGEGDQ